VGFFFPSLTVANIALVQTRERNRTQHRNLRGGERVSHRRLGRSFPSLLLAGISDVPGRGLEGEASPGAPRLRCGQNLKGNKSALSSGPNVDECRWSPWPELLEAGWLVLKQRATSSRPPVTPGWSAGLQTTLSSAWPAEQ